MERRNVIILLVGLLVVASLAAGCRIGEEDEDIYCPSCDETLSWENTSQHSACYYGPVNKFDFDGDDHGWQLRSDCGWIVDPEHQGGVGDVLVLYYPINDSVTFVWAYQELFRIVLEKNWRGQTAEGIRMGCSLEQFLETYPEMKYGYEWDGEIEYYMPDYEYQRLYGTDEALFYADFDSESLQLIRLSLEDIY